MNIDKSVAELSQQVQDLTQALCELSRLFAQLTENLDDNLGCFTCEGFRVESEQAKLTHQAIILELNPNCYCPDCGDSYHYQYLPDKNVHGLGCDCPDKPVLTCDDAIEVILYRSYPSLVGDRPITFIPSAWIKGLPIMKPISGTPVPNCTE